MENLIARSTLFVILLTAGGEVDPANLESPDAGLPRTDASTAGSSDASAPDVEEIDAGLSLLPTGVTAIDSISFDDPFPTSALAGIVGDARVVSVGETVHFSLGYSRARARVIRSLIEDFGFRAVAFEGPWTSALLANDFVNGIGTDQDLLVGLTFGAWMNQPTVELFHFIRDWNASGREPIKVFGFDIQDPTGDGLMIRERLDQLRAAGAVSEDAAQALRSSLVGCPGASAGSVEEAYSTHPDAPILLLERPLTPARREACLETVEKGRRFIREVEDQLSARDRTFLEAAYRSLAAFVDELYYAYDYRLSNEARDHGMADVFGMLADEFAPGQRIANFAHNGHNLRRAETIDTEYGFKSHGTWLGERLGDDYAPIGFLAATVDWNWGDEYEPGHWETTLPDAVETILRDLSSPHLLVDLETATAEGGLFAPGRRYAHEHDLNRSSPIDNYRGLFFMQASEAWDGKVFLDR